MPSDSDVMNTLEAAAFLGVHVETLRKIARRNEIPSFKIGRDWRFRKEALVRWADNQRAASSGAPLVLVVDNDADFCRVLARDTVLLGCRALEASNGEAALALVQRDPPNLIFLDLKMPGMSCPAFLETLRETHPALPVVVVTGYPDSHLMEQAALYAPIMLLTKPVNPVLLARTLQSVLGLKISTVR